MKSDRHLVALREEIAERRALARHARSRGLHIARRFHVEFALAARKSLRAA